ncbi:MAG: hypothetical protein ACODAC_08645 [Pseudomonadota bacterium]
MIMLRGRLAVLIALLSSAALAGCENLPGSREEQTTAAGGAVGAAVGASVSDNSLLGILLGGAAGAAGGYLIGARTDWFDEDSDERSSEARAAVERARADPATAEDVAGTDSGDLNDDGFVTMDELVAMDEAGLDDDDIVHRLQETDQVFELSDEQRERLETAGLSRELLAEIEEINREERDEILAGSDVIGRPED